MSNEITIELVGGEHEVLELNDPTIFGVTYPTIEFRTGFPGYSNVRAITLDLDSALKIANLLKDKGFIK